MKTLNKILCACLIVCTIVAVFPKTEAYAASNGDKRRVSQTLTLQEINQLCNTFENILNKAGTATNIASATVTGAGLFISPAASAVLGFSVMGVSTISTAAFRADYNFYNGVRNKMISYGAQKVSIVYTQTYRVNRMYGDYTGGWYVTGKSASQYYIYK